MILVRTEEQAKLSITGSGNKVRWMVGHEDGSSNFEMRKITLPPGGKSSKGSHLHEHVVYILGGIGRVVGDDGEQQLIPHKAVFIPGGEEHQWINDSKTEELVFLCVIPSGSEDFLK